jgi:hypothetical protein
MAMDNIGGSGAFSTFVAGDPFGYRTANTLRTALALLALGIPARTLQASVTLTPTQVKALHTTPVQLVAAPGAGIVALVHQITFAATFGSVAYTGANALEFRYTNASGAKVTADIAAATLNFASGTRLATVAGVTTELTPVANAAIVVGVPTANPAAGDSPITFLVHYSELVVP